MRVHSKVVLKYTADIIIRRHCQKINLRRIRANHLLQTNEADGRKIQRILFPNAGSDVTGMVARSEKVAGSAEKVDF